MSSTEPSTADAIEQLHARGRQLAPPTDPTTGQAAAPAPAPAAAPARSSTRRSSSTRRPPSRFTTSVGPPVTPLPTPRTTTGRIPLRLPKPAADAAQRGGGILLGLIAYAVGLNYVRDGWPGVTAWLRAKTLNNVGNPPAGGGGGGLRRYQLDSTPIPAPAPVPVLPPTAPGGAGIAV